MKVGDICSVSGSPLREGADLSRLFGVADEILLKPGPLTALERRAMEQHAKIGHDILGGSELDLLELAATIAWTHHERVDGSGYPRRLTGSEIPLEGRIVAVVDVYDALTNHRPYRRALTSETALDLMRTGKGTQFGMSPPFMSSGVAVFADALYERA